MNKKILYFGIAFVITALAAINVNVNSYKRGLSDVSLANVEALARNEIVIGPFCIQADNFCVEEPIDIDPYWYFTYPFENL